MPGRSGYQVVEYVTRANAPDPAASSVTALMSLRAVDGPGPSQAPLAHDSSDAAQPPLAVGRSDPVQEMPRSPDATRARMEADRYFEQIDQAFLTLAQGSRPPFPRLSDQQVPDLDASLAH